MNDLLGLSTPAPAPAPVAAAGAPVSSSGGLVDLFGLDTGPSPVHNAALPPNASAPSIPSLAAAQPTPAAPPPSNGQLLMEAAKEASPAATTGGASLKYDPRPDSSRRCRSSDSVVSAATPT